MNTSADKRIIEFIRSHHVLTVATTDGDTLHCSNLFYSYSMRLGGVFVVTSSSETLHVSHLSHSDRIAASIVLETSVIGKVRGLQIRGRMYRPVGEMFAKARNAYLKKFPFAVVMDLDMWIIEPDYLKFTDNRLGFGKKIIWEKV